MTVTLRTRRSPHAQMIAMKEKYPSFDGKKDAQGTLSWIGILRPKSVNYSIAILWHPKLSLPYVRIIDPPLKPRSEEGFENIPHLIYDQENPQQSGLCLFDPEGHEWSNVDLIAETTIPWTAEWLLYYELWHLTGDWLAPSVGYESIADLKSSEAKAIREAISNVY